MHPVLYETETLCFHNLYQWLDETEWIAKISASLVLGQKIPFWQSGRIDTGDEGRLCGPTEEGETVAIDGKAG